MRGGAASSFPGTVEVRPLTGLQLLLQRAERLPLSRKKSSKKTSTDLMELDESDEVRKPRKIKGLGPKTSPEKSFEDQVMGVPPSLPSVC